MKPWLILRIPPGVCLPCSIRQLLCLLVDTKWCHFFSLGGCKVRWPRQAPQPSVVLSLKLGMKYGIQMEGRCACPAEKVKSTCLGV